MNLKHLAKRINTDVLENGFECEMKDMVSANDTDIYWRIRPDFNQEMVKTMSKSDFLRWQIPCRNYAEDMPARIYSNRRSDFPNQIIISWLSPAFSAARLIKNK